MPEPKVVTETKIVKPTIMIVDHPEPLTFADMNMTVITEKNVNEVIKTMKEKKGYFVIYGLDPQSFSNLAISLEQIKRYIEQQKQIILYYEKSVK
tara:strand:+ start:481 stop:765 length:285 start_codon:yes stop_codon:yes gene_type:complete